MANRKKPQDRNKLLLDTRKASKKGREFLKELEKVTAGKPKKLSAATGENVGFDKEAVRPPLCGRG